MLPLEPAVVVLVPDPAVVLVVAPGVLVELDVVPVPPSVEPVVATEQAPFSRVVVVSTQA